MAVTHELKTPIAVAQLNLETLQKRKLDETKQQKLISNTLQETNRLNTLCNNILLAARFDAGAYKVNKQEINLSELVNGSIAQFVLRYPDRFLQKQVADEIFVLGEELQLQMLVNNLIENALKYAPKLKPILVSLSMQQRKAILQVADNGNGISDEDKPYIFEKFYRSGDETTRNTKGTGLGLYLCKKIVESHQGKISLQDNQPTGCIFTITINA